VAWRDQWRLILEVLPETLGHITLLTGSKPGNEDINVAAFDSVSCDGNQCTGFSPSADIRNAGRRRPDNERSGRLRHRASAHIAKAHELMESNLVRGKLVVGLD